MTPTRRARPDDADAAFQLMAELGYEGLDRASFLRTFAAEVERPDALLIVATDSADHAVALVAITHRPLLHLQGELVSIDTMVVARRARGRGIGEQLIAEAKAFAERIGAKRVELNTNRTRESYRRGFYAKNGFFEVNSAILRLESGEEAP